MKNQNTAMKVFDQHLHSRHSCDSKADPRENVLSAIERGLPGLIFTEHFDTHPDDWESCNYDDAAYSATIASLRAEFGDRIFVGKGIEVCFQPDKEDFLVEFLRGHRFDMVTLSIHYFGGRPLHRREAWSDRTAMEGTRMYLENALAGVRWCRSIREKYGRMFDVLGHLDLAKRYTHRFFGSHDVAPFGEQIDEILRTCLEADILPEINTSTLRQGLPETMPGPATVKRYAELGGKMMSIGSDSHKPSDIGEGFEPAVQMLKASGLRAARFRGRVAEEVDLT